MEEKNIVQEMTAVMREADKVFETVGGSTRHYVRDVLLPLMERYGLRIIQQCEPVTGLPPLPEPILTDKDMKDREAGQPESAPSGEISQGAHEKGIMMQAFDEVRQIFEGRQWIMEGRGSYPYNDDRYKEEVRYMYDEFDAIQKDTWENIESKSFEYRKAIVAEYVKGTAAGREEDAVEFAEWIRSNHYNVYGNMWRRTGSNMEVSSARLYKLSKQQQEKP